MQKQIVLFILLLPSLSYGQIVNLIGLKPKYRQGEPIIFTVQNKNDSVVFVSSFILQKYSSKLKEWYEGVHDITNNYPCSEESDVENSDKAGHIGYSLKVDSTRTISWNPKKENPNCFNYKKSSGKYRLLFIYRNDLELGRKYHYYLKEFYITK
jgi:hypothetical protein